MSRDAGRLRVTYQLTCAGGEDPEAKARDIAARTVGRVEAVEPVGGSRWRAVISFDSDLVGCDDAPNFSTSCSATSA